MEYGLITDIQRFCIHDGPGIRTTVFFKGCPLKCRWCHNPETQDCFRQVWHEPHNCILCGTCACVCPAGCHSIRDGEHDFDSLKCVRCGRCVNMCPSKALNWCGEEKSVDEVINAVLADSPFYENDGGMTLSGGEPMLQGNFAIALLKKAKEAGLNTCVETCGMFNTAYLDDLCLYADNLLWDLKDYDSERHRRNTGVGLEVILDNLKHAAERCADKITVRNIQIEKITANPETVDEIKKICREYGIEKVKFFPFHPYGSGKKNNIGDRISERMGNEFIPR